jgi:hypothetical protein
VTGAGKCERRARLTVGETVYVAGTLTCGADPSAGYRGGSERLVLRPPRRGRMLLSTAPPHPPFEGRARFARTWAIVFLGYTLTVSWWLHFPYWITSLEGATRPAAVVAMGMRRTQSRNSGLKGQVPFVTARALDGGWEVTSEVSDGASQRLGVGSRVPIVLHPRWREHGQVGQRPTEEVISFLVSLVTLGLLLLSFVIARIPLGTPWYEQRRISLHVPGPLPPWPPEP